MKREKIVLAVLFCAMVLVTGGCGEKPISLTNEEESIIVYYAAHVVSKYNTRQPDGVTYVPPEELQEETETEEVTDTQEQGTETELQGSEAAEGTAPTQPEIETVSLTEALGLEGITAEYAGAELKSSYTEEEYVSFNAASGYIYLAVSINLKNTTDAEVNCDMLTKKISIQATVNGEQKAVAKTTVLLNDLGTYQDKIAAGETVSTILLFEVPDVVTEVNSLTLKMTQGDSVKETIL